MTAYEQLLQKHSTDYNKVDHRNVDRQVLGAFFSPGSYRHHRFQNLQDFDFEGLWGRMRSSSYTPAPGHPGYQPMLAALQELFERHANDGKVSFLYATPVYIGDFARSRRVRFARGICGVRDPS